MKPDFLTRLEDEHFELEIKIKALTEALQNARANNKTIGSERNHHLLEKQHSLMKSYALVLEERIKDINYELATTSSNS